MSERGQRVVVMGLGLFGGGAAVARYFVERGARVLVTDTRDEATLQAGIEAVGEARDSIEWVLGEHRKADFVTADLIVANPAVPPNHPLLEASRRAGVRITSETELFLENCRARLAIITGTQGKSSTASMAAQLLNASGFRAHLCGNVGRSLLEKAARFDPADICVLEISSYQLEAMKGRFSGASRAGSFENVEVVALTNVLADHLERHGTVEAYARAKAYLFELPRRAFAIVPHSGLPAPAVVTRPGIERVVFAESPIELGPGDDSSRALWLGGGEFCFGPGSHPAGHSESDAEESAGESPHGGDPPHGHESLGRTRELPLPGEFQKANALVALGIARLMGASAAALRAAVPDLRGLAHRMELLPAIRGRTIYDNGVSTTPDSTAAALSDLPEGSLLICGGRAKRLSFDGLAELCARRRARVVTFGAAAEDLGRAMRQAGAEVRTIPDLGQATLEALAWSAPGETLLFSPACASFDAFPNFSARARAFRQTVERWERDESEIKEHVGGAETSSSELEGGDR